MRVVILVEAFSKRQGYLQNCLPAAMGRLGLDVHLIASPLPPYHTMPSFSETWGSFAQKGGLEPGAVEKTETHTIHILPARMSKGNLRRFGDMMLVGLGEKLKELAPDIVQTNQVHGLLPVQAGLARGRVGFRLFTGCHYHRSVFSLEDRSIPHWARNRILHSLTRAPLGRWVASRTERCYCIAEDCAYIASHYFGVPERKIRMSPLGVDTKLFSARPDDPSVSAGKELRRKLGFRDDEIVCIYSGRLTEDKNPLLLAKAVARLSAQGAPYRGLFMGNGPQEAEIARVPGCVTHPFVDFPELPPYFHAADLGVWPTQESMSILDAAACGLPVVANDTVHTPERVEGNGMLYRLNDLDDLSRVLLELGDAGLRERLGRAGAEKMAARFSWEANAQARITDYEEVLGRKGTRN